MAQRGQQIPSPPSSVSSMFASEKSEVMWLYRMARFRSHLHGIRCWSICYLHIAKGMFRSHPHLHTCIII